MTNDEVRRAMTRIADATMARRAEIDAHAQRPVDAAARGGAPFAVGDRVLDTVSGREGTVAYVGVAVGGGSRLFSVQFDDGSAAIRGVADLVARPTPPRGRSFAPRGPDVARSGGSRDRASDARRLVRGGGGERARVALAARPIRRTVEGSL